MKNRQVLFCITYSLLSDVSIPFPYDGSVFAPKDRQKVQKMANSLGVSYTAFVTRLREFKLLERHPIEEYISGTLQFGDSL